MKAQSLIKLQGYYISPKNNYPEGREQFAFYYDYHEIAIYGGLTSNKNISVWSFDMGK